MKFPKAKHPARIFFRGDVGNHHDLQIHDADDPSNELMLKSVTIEVFVNGLTTAVLRHLDGTESVAEVAKAPPVCGVDPSVVVVADPGLVTEAVTPRGPQFLGGT